MKHPVLSAELQAIWLLATIAHYLLHFLIDNFEFLTFIWKLLLHFLTLDKQIFQETPSFLDF